MVFPIGVRIDPEARPGRRDGRSLWQDSRARFMHNRAAVASASVLLLVCLYSIVGPVSSEWSTEAIDWQVIGDVKQHGRPSLGSGHFFGTDELGRDLFVRTAMGTRVSLMVGIFGALVAMVVGTLYGAVSGYVGGVVDSIMMRIVDMLMAIPFMFVLILLLMVFGRSVTLLFIGIGLVSWLDMARIVRGQTLSIKQMEFVEHAVATGVSTAMIVWRHIIPNILGVVVVYATLLVPNMILYESFISFLGLGVQEPNASLGSLINSGASRMQYGTLWQIGFPLFFFVAVLLGFFFVGDGMRDALDPREGNG